MEVMEAVGVPLRTFTQEVLLEDQSESSSLTLNEIVWLPTDNELVVKFADEDKTPSIEDIHW